MQAISPEQLENLKQLQHTLQINEANQATISENKEADVQKLMDAVDCWFDQWYTGDGFYSERYGFSRRQGRSNFELPQWTMADVLSQPSLDALNSFSIKQ